MSGVAGRMGEGEKESVPAEKGRGPDLVAKVAGSGPGRRENAVLAEMESGLPVEVARRAMDRAPLGSWSMRRNSTPIRTGP